MSPTSPFLVLPALAMALLTTKLFIKLSGKKPPLVQYIAIDGLRGYLAFFVFLHHASFWYFYLHTNVWAEPPSHMYVHFGGMSVSLFFMITGFLFFQKLINNNKKPVDWVRLFVSRVLRLYPVYLIAILFGFLIVLSLSQWKINDRPIPFLHEIFQWSAFTVVGKPPINHTTYMDFITAGVTWTLIYEWLFYLSLPIIGLVFFRARVNVIILLLSIFLVFLVYKYNLLKPINFYSFGAGLLAAFLVKWKRFITIIHKKIYSAIAILCLAAAVYFFETPYEIFPLTLIAIAFIIIAGGNNLFGLLSNKVSRTMGQISYPLYLLHPILLFVTFRFVLGFDETVHQPVYIYWLIVSVCAFALVLICFAIHYFIELPCMKATEKVTAAIRKRIGK
ncbi:MAG TPA: acyltransferase [Ginsengibacter sp.]